MRNQDTRQRILDIARDQLAEGGVETLSFDAIARRLGRSKQAVLYWFPSKTALVSALFLPWLEAETRAAECALKDSSGVATAIAAFVRAITGFHLSDLDRFRMMYLVPQTLRRRSVTDLDADAMSQVPPVTDRLYGALAACLAPNAPDTARKQAFVIHSSVLGLVLMLSLADAIGDPLKHSAEDLVETLIASLVPPQPE